MKKTIGYILFVLFIAGAFTMAALMYNLLFAFIIFGMIIFLSAFVYLIIYLITSDK